MDTRLNTTIGCFQIRLNDLSMKLSAKNPDDNKIGWLITYLYITLNDLKHEYPAYTFDHAFIRGILNRITHYLNGNTDGYNAIDIRDGIANLRLTLKHIGR